MSESWYTPPEEETPLAKMWRQQLAHEEKLEAFLDRFIESIPPEASGWDLFSHHERTRWGLKGYRKRP